MDRDSFYINNNMSASLELFIRNIDTYEEFEKRFSDEFLDEDARLGNYLAYLLDKYNKKQARVADEAGMSQAYVGKIVRGENRNPSRNTLISICLSIGTTVEEVQYLLKYAGYSPLYVRRKRDVIIWFSFMKNKSVQYTNDILYSRGYPLLGSEKFID